MSTKQPARNDRTVAYLASEIPSISATFVYREIAAMRTGGVTVVPFSIHAVARKNVSPDGLSFFDETDVLYDSVSRLLANAFTTIVRHPGRALRTIATAVRDAAGGEFASRGQRWKVFPQLCAGLALAERFESRGIGHLHVHFAHSPANVGMYAASAAGIPFSITAHANDIYVEGSLLREKIERARPFVTISEANRRYLRERFGSVAESVELVRCGVDVSEFTPEERTTSGPRIFALGRLVPKKGFDILLRAVAASADALPDLRVRLAGDGPKLDELRSLARDLEILDRVDFLGAVSKQQVADELAAAALFALPCRVDPSGDVDGIPVCLMEAMAAGVPVVSSRLSGIPELIENDATGVLVAPESVGELTAGIERVLSSPELRDRIARDARAFVAEQFNLTSNALRLATLILQQPRSSKPPRNAACGEVPIPAGN